jgi:predicted unusual protein kinase regulating ubiquinone biosynthesis (AarF/ABC1/UbiB family)
MTDRPDPPPPDRGVPRGRLARSLPLVSLTAQTAAQAARRADGWPGRAAQRYAELLGRSRGALMKAGQVMSFVAIGPAVPDEQRALYQAALARLQDSAPPMPGAQAVAVAEAELRRPLSAVFAEFTREPMAAASIGQVHAARLHGGRAVAVKIQYPGVAEAIRSDLRNGELLATFLQLARPLTGARTDLTALAGEIGARIEEELDYRAEAAHQAGFAAAYRGHPFIRIPEIIPDLCTGRVLTMDLAVGRRWAQAVTAPGPLRDRWGEVIVRFALGSLRRLGVVNADPHPGNYLFHDDGAVTFLDFGSVKRYSTPQVAMLDAAAQAASDGDAAGLRRVLAAAGLVGPADPPEPAALLAWLREALTPILAPQPFRFTPDLAADLVRAGLAPGGPHAAVVGRLTVPAEFVSLARVNLEITAVLGALRAAGEWDAIRREQAAGDPAAAATPLGRRDLAFWNQRPGPP